MLKNDRDRKICAKYSARDENGYVHCNECPLHVHEYEYGYQCKANMHLDKHKRDWEWDVLLKHGKWVKKEGNYLTPGGTPCYVCSNCGGSEHLYGVEFTKKKAQCDKCGSINTYPWEKEKSK